MTRGDRSPGRAGAELHPQRVGTAALETFTDADYLDSPEALRSYNRLWGRLQAAAVGPAESRRLILRIADEMK
ncbi:hypothetical protein MCAG_02761 [Micromonospora sp. ATCC 39149]|uniref:Scr1 family TA system antitoxin-like transcriptional regulator n=1 Tax=Micromonospora sp. (strain ATCC 39149 / NRRL 15099 / SCC 1413) TaxID=219305 RepID=UPI0001A506EC|nr:Scr1 family TA system antitoxin-like transcriptional regulator [Micromonospora sp. ATCC 39149]EEP72434.1 hypothetical protein MCAG_02761 [Micromonospora sp. ATCC 39149]